MQELLYTIHYMASKYYASKGVMLDASTQYHTERMRNWKAKKRAKAAALEGDDSGRDGSSKPANEEDDWRSRNAKRRRGDNLMRDMVHALDGEVLMALGACSFTRRRKWCG